MKKQWIVHGIAVLGLMLALGSGCSGDKGKEGQMAALQAQLQSQGQISSLQQQNAVLQQKMQDYQKCKAAGGTDAACATIQN